MKKSWICLLVLITSLFLIVLVSAEVRMNEVELNPSGTDAGNEWVELYSENSVDLTGWNLKNSDNDSFELNQTFNGYLIINFKSQWLDNSNEKILLYNNNQLIDETDLLSDPYNDNRTRQYCNGGWKIEGSTKGFENICNLQNNSQNQSQNNTNNTNNQEESISLDMDWNVDDIVNGDEFDIEITAKNLEDKKYDIMVWIEGDGKVISDRYGEDGGGDEVWLSGSRYAYNFIEGPGDKSEIIKLKMRDDFSGDAEIMVKIRKSGTSPIITKASKDIEILEKESDSSKDSKSTKNTATKKSDAKTTKNDTKTTTKPSLSQPVTGEVIKLGNSKSEDIIDPTKSTEKNLIYESKNEKMKKYAIIGFSVLCLGFVILVIFKKVK